MKYSIQNIDTKNKFLFFWGHQPSKSGSLTTTCLSQWWQSSFTVNGITYQTAEHFMMVKKAELFDPEKASSILTAKTPAEAKKIGRTIENFNDKKWLQQRFEIVKEANMHKFHQNQDLKLFLLQSAPRILVEASPVDSIWGIGLSADNPDSQNPNSWKGLNLLGFALMGVRDLLSEIQ